MLQHRVRYMSEAIAAPLLLLTVLQLSTRRHDNRSADHVVSVAMPRNFLPSTLSTGLYRDELTYLLLMPARCVIVYFCDSESPLDTHI